MLLQSAKDIFNNFEEVEITNHLCDLVSSETVFCEKFYQYILDKNILSPKNSFTLEFYNYLDKSKAYEQIYNLFFSRELELCQYNQLEFLLNSLNEMGRTSDFQLKAKEVTEYLLLNKLYPAFKKFTKRFSDQIDKQNYFLIAELIVNIDLGNITNTVKILEKIYKISLSENQNISLIETTVGILGLSESEDYRISKYKCFFKILISLKKTTLVSREDLTEALLFSEDELSYILVLEASNDKSLDRDLLIYLKKNYQVKLNSIPSFFKKVRKYLETELPIVKSKILEKDNYEFPEERFEKIKQTKKNIRKNILSYKLEMEEINLIKHFEYDTREELISSDIVISFINLEFYSLAKKIALMLPDSTNQAYLLCRIYFNLNEFSECIYTANNCLTNFKLQEDDSVPFEYLKAVSFEQLGDNESATLCFKRIVSINPRFKNAKDKLSR